MAQYVPGWLSGLVDAVKSGPSSGGYSSGLIRTARPNDTTAYAALDVVGGVIVLPRMAPAGGGEMLLTSLVFGVEDTALISTEANYTLYLYSAPPPSNYADNAPWDLLAADRAFCLTPNGVAIATPIDVGSSLASTSDVINKQMTAVSSTLYAYVVTVPAYTPTASRVSTLWLHTLAL